MLWLDWDGAGARLFICPAMHWTQYTNGVLSLLLSGHSGVATVLLCGLRQGVPLLGHVVRPFLAMLPQYKTLVHSCPGSGTLCMRTSALTSTCEDTVLWL